MYNRAWQTCSNALDYWAVQVGLLTPLTFAQHSLSPLAAFTSGAYFLHNGRRWQWICEFYTANFKKHFWRPVVIMCQATSNNSKRISSMKLWSFGQPKTTQRHVFSTLHLLSLVIFATAAVVAFVLLCNSRFNFHCYTQHEATPTQKSARKWCCDLSWLVQKITKGVDNHDLLWRRFVF